MRRTLVIGISVVALIVTVTGCKEVNSGGSPSTPSATPAVGG